MFDLLASRPGRQTPTASRWSEEPGETGSAKGLLAVSVVLAVVFLFV